MTTDEARAAFAASGLTYADITHSRFLELATAVQRCLESDPGTVGLRLSRKMVYLPSPGTGGMTEAYLYVDGDYFHKREAISFNRDGFIGFAGWSSTANCRPLLEGFRIWVGKLTLASEPLRVGEWVLVRNSEGECWTEPLVLIDRSVDEFRVKSGWWKYARRATRAEIEYYAITKARSANAGVSLSKRLI